MYDVAGDVYRLRALTEAPLDLSRLEYRNQRERTAHDLLARRGAVQIVSENRIAGTGLELTGKVTVAEDRREYRPQMLLNDEGQVSKAECTCTFFRKQGLKAGPCAHLIALRLAYAEQEARRAQEAGPRRASRSRRALTAGATTTGADVVQVTLDRTGSRCAGAGRGSRCGCRCCASTRPTRRGRPTSPALANWRSADSWTRRRSSLFAPVRGRGRG